MIYTIPKGQHYSQPRRFGLHFGRTKQTWLVRFTESCLAIPQEYYHQWNKGTGWTYSLLSDANSVRWCWRVKPTDLNVLEVGIYTHLNGRAYEPTYTIELPQSLNEDFTFVLYNEWQKGKIWLDVHGEHISQTVDESFSIKPGFIGYLNHVYYGGRNPAPAEITIEVKTV